MAPLLPQEPYCTDKPTHWLEAAPEDETARRDYFVRLITILSHKVGREVMAEAIRGALEVRR